jgi:DNA processing protein
LASAKHDFRPAGAKPAKPAKPDPTESDLPESEKRDWIRLIRTENIGPITFHQLIGHFGSAGAALDAIPELRKRGGMQRPGRVHSARDAEAEMRAAEKAGVRIAALPEADYPPMLRHIDAPPPLIYMKGDPAHAARPTIAIVGSRSASAAGRQFANSLARDLGENGITVASGLARGIDTAAHNGALRTGTVAVLAGGVDIVYPPENAELHAAIAAQGLIISECPLGFLPRGQDFPRRNRVISGISIGVVVVEAAQRSGSLITARMALEQNRDVFAVPGHPLDPRAIGTNELIKSGACLVTCAQDIIDAVAPAHLSRSGFAEKHQAAAPECLTDALGTGDLQSLERHLIMEALSLTPVSTDILVRNTGLSPSQVAMALLELDLAGRLERHGQSGISLKSDSKISYDAAFTP